MFLEIEKRTNDPIEKLVKGHESGPYINEKILRLFHYNSELNLHHDSNFHHHSDWQKSLSLKTYSTEKMGGNGHSNITGDSENYTTPALLIPNKNFLKSWLAIFKKLCNLMNFCLRIIT